MTWEPRRAALPRPSIPTSSDPVLPRQGPRAARFRQPFDHLAAIKRRRLSLACLSEQEITTTGKHEELIVNQVSCECGYSVRDDDEDRVVEATMRHVSSAHPELVTTVTPDVVRGWIELVP